MAREMRALSSGPARVGGWEVMLCESGLAGKLLLFFLLAAVAAMTINDFFVYSVRKNE
jgi:hypothetical protein